MRLQEWTAGATDVDTDSSIDLEKVSDKAWDFYYDNIDNQWIFRLFGVSGRIYKIWEDVFGPEPL